MPADAIRALARQMAATRTMLTASWSLQRADHGEQPYWALVLLAACLGQIELPGGGFGFGYGSGATLAEPPLSFPGPAMPRGIGDGEVVRVFNARGACFAGVSVTDSVRPGVVRLSGGA